MKKSIYKIGALFFILSLVTLISFSVHNSKHLSQTEKNLIGVWICDGDQNWKIKFNDNAKCYQYYSSDPIEEYSYKILSVTSKSGIEHTYIILTTIKSDVYEVGEIIEYEINSLEDDKLTIESFKPKINYFYFTKSLK